MPGCSCMHLGPWCLLMLQDMLCSWNKIIALTFCWSPHIHLAPVSNEVHVNWLTWVGSAPWIPLRAGKRGLYHELYCLNLILWFHLAPADSLDVLGGFGSSNIALSGRTKHAWGQNIHNPQGSPTRELVPGWQQCFQHSLFCKTTSPVLKYF